MFSLSLATALQAQCFPTWQPGLGIPGVNHHVHGATSWDPDGAGPAQPLVVFGGDFSQSGEWPFGYVTGWLPQLGQFVNMTGLDHRATAFATMPNGELVAGGAFTGGVARFDGITWTTLGNGLEAEVRALAVLPNGDLVAGGDFQIAFGVGLVSNIARWDGSTWHPLGSGTDLRVRALVALPNGDLVAGGDFTTAGGVASSRIARWNGSTWAPLGSGMGGAANSNISVYAMAVLGNGDVVAGGAFTTAGGNPAARLARWNGTAWSGFGSGANSIVQACHTAANGDLLIGGAFTQIDNLTATRLARWNGSTFSPLGSGTDSSAYTTLTTRNGDLVVGGSFRMLEGVVARRIARRTGTVWTPLGSGMTNTTSVCDVRSVVELPNGDLVAAGVFSHAGGVAVTNVARWNGTTWAPLGPGLPIGVESLLALPNGDVIAGGPFHTAYGAAADFLARWNGTTWAPLGGNFSGPWFGSVSELALLPNGDVVAGGVFTAAAGVATDNLARWDGSQWHAFGQPISASSRVGALTVTQNGDLLVGGTWTMIGGIAANFIARWNGSTWSPVGNLTIGPGTSVWCLAELPDGDVMAGGSQLRSFGLIAGLVRWDGTYWLPPWSPAGSVVTLAMTSDGDLAAGGSFTTQSHAANFALLRTPCTPTATTFGAGCTGSGGANTLTAATLPWTGATFRARATGLAPNSLAIGVRGLSTGSTPLQPLLAQALPGCHLFVSPDLLDLHLPNIGAPGTADIAFAIPDAPALTGAVLHLQVVPVVFAGTGAIAEFSASNALTLTIGSF